MRNQIAATIARYGEPVELTTKADGVTSYITASVQIPVAGTIVNDFDLTGFMVYVRPQDLASPPRKFDPIHVRGQWRSVEEVEEEYLSGVLIVYVLRIRG
jgi:hypothetical protein